MRAAAASCSNFPHGEYVPVSGAGRAPAAARLLAPVRRGGAVKRAADRGRRASCCSLAGAGVAYYLHVKQQSRDVKGSSTVEFVTTQEAVPPPPKEPGVAWPTYGHDPRAAAVRERRHARAAVQARLDVPRAEPRRVSAGRRVRAPLLRQQRGRAVRDRREERPQARWKYVSHRCVAASPARRPAMSSTRRS